MLRPKVMTWKPSTGTITKKTIKILKYKHYFKKRHGAYLQVDQTVQRMARIKQVQLLLQRKFSWALKKTPDQKVISSKLCWIGESAHIGIYWQKYWILRIMKNNVFKTLFPAKRTRKISCIHCTSLPFSCTIIVQFSQRVCLQGILYLTRRSLLACLGKRNHSYSAFLVLDWDSEESMII